MWYKLAGKMRGTALFRRMQIRFFNVRVNGRLVEAKNRHWYKGKTE